MATARQTSSGKAGRPVISALLRSRRERKLYDYRVSHLDWKEKTNITGSRTPGRGNPFSFINMQCKHYPFIHFFPSHSHPMFELYAVMNGKVAMSMASGSCRRVELGAGTAILMAPQQFHSARSTGPASVINLHFTPVWPPSLRKKMVQACGQKLRLSPFAREGLRLLVHLPGRLDSADTARALSGIFQAVLIHDLLGPPAAGRKK